MKENRKLLEVYKPADTYFIVNDGDIDLTPIRISQPKPPPIELIDGYGLDPGDQYFRYVTIPQGIKTLESRAFDICMENYKRNNNNVITGEKILREFWGLFNENMDDLEEEIKFIKTVHWHRTYGYWVFIDGKPTYLPPDYYDFLNFYRMADCPDNEGRPEFREDDRIRYLFWHYLETTHETFTDLDNEGNAIKNKDGSYNISDVGVRTFFGGAEPKIRRGGATHQGCHKIIKGVTSDFNLYGTIISMDGDNAETHYFKKLVPAFNKYPLFLKPVWTGDFKSRSISLNSRFADNVVSSYLGGIIDYTESAGEHKNDGDKIHYYISDEEGKAGAGSNILERWNVNKFTQSTGNGANIFGFCLHPSTVEEMDEGGIDYYKLCRMSDFYVRIPGKFQTPSGLGLMFVPGYRRLEGFIDRFGKSVIHKPTERQKRLSPDSIFTKMNIGALDYIMSERAMLLAQNTPESLETYRSIVRKIPIQFAECWLGSSGDVGFDLEIVDKRIAELRRVSNIIRGNFKWENDIVDSRVIFVRDNNGRFEVSLLLDDKATNQKTKERVWVAKNRRWEYHYAPLYPERFTFGVDTFGYDNKTTAKQRTNRSRQSDGGISGLREHDPEIDKSEDMTKWIETFKFILSYRHRSESTYDFNEDALMAAVYYGGTVYIERNKENTWEHFVNRGYSGYLQYDFDPVSGKKVDKPGVYSLEKSKEVLFMLTKNYIKYRGHVEDFITYLHEVKSIQGTEQMTLYDRFTAHGLALMGSRSKSGTTYYSKKHTETISSQGSIVDMLRKLSGR